MIHCDPKKRKLESSFLSLYDDLWRLVNILLIIFCILSSKVVLADQEIVILMLGDSLTAGYGLPQDYTIPSRLERALKKQNINVRIINIGWWSITPILVN